MTRPDLAWPPRPPDRVRHSWRCTRRGPLLETAKTDATGRARVCQMWAECGGDDLAARCRSFPRDPTDPSAQVRSLSVMSFFGCRSDPSTTARMSGMPRCCRSARPPRWSARKGFGLYVEHQVNSDGTYDVRLHVPKPGVTAGLGRGGQPEPLGFGCEVERIASSSENPRDNDNEADDGQDSPNDAHGAFPPSTSRLSWWSARNAISVQR